MNIEQQKILEQILHELVVMNGLYAADNIEMKHAFRLDLEAEIENLEYILYND